MLSASVCPRPALSTLLVRRARPWPDRIHRPFDKREASFGEQKASFEGGERGETADRTLCFVFWVMPVLKCSQNDGEREEKDEMIV